MGKESYFERDIIMIPKLEKLLDDKFVLVLGAGASMDYSMPPWKWRKLKRKK